ncbi:hypothetical protein A2154_03980 [Candidatus Gottesmanbacteria bacterium RBG_16_43_7]|uniref:Orn/DAP/Arg decarboxylase 2 N-terminal domain-containing protein n=1 Tax=Candidatus Gottesmanbacteria bacterium RBG_16_43_7 TaxID=1798373 RepID=A0A1F5Z8K5_9BACT|nr:MAG: hypothetical protein A2154_03980 [Candidatus Gottesmanbacteria bacterium RBG_16_43_7]
MSRAEIIKDPRSGELFGPTYRDIIAESTNGSRIWEFFSYNQKGELLYGPRFYNSEGRLIQDGVNIPELISRYGSPLEVVDPVIAQIRARQWDEMFANVATQVEYRLDGNFRSFATKAAPAMEIVTAAIGAGWSPEASSEQDIYNAIWLKKHDLLPDWVKILANGYKFPPEGKYSRLDPLSDGFRMRSYAEMIVDANIAGIRVVPIIDSLAEIPFFGSKRVPKMEVGIRFKAYGKKPGISFEELPARHGETWEGVVKAARELTEQGHLLTTFHAMISAADSVPVDEFVGSLLEAVNYFFELRKHYPSLEHFNIGGGMPTLSSNYDHEGFLTKLLTGLKVMAEKSGQTMPILDVEFGTYISAEAGIAVLQLENIKVNGVESGGVRIPWGVSKGSYNREIIDQWLLAVRYKGLAGNYANNRSRLMRLGDSTCDKQGILLTDAKRPNTIFMPRVPEGARDLIVVIPEQQAYEEALTGIGGVQYCLSAEAKDIIIVRDKDGRVTGELVQNNQNPDRTLHLLGYNIENIPHMRRFEDSRGPASRYQGYF